ncbi:MAG: YkgJ family cysteine cluster protein [Desulfobacteraceae bacterium]|jgi:Fe-S-cluster containining protein|nr:MAG: YkgJ family cysteine cluster protein [Desulfobacteraceae bacterium]
MPVNPCLKCGACCAFFRASFYWAEIDEFTPGGVPAELTEKLSPQFVVMKGTNQPMPRCTALTGEIGRRVACAIYENRASVCREFEPAWENGIANIRCDKARITWGLSPLTPESWFDFNLPRAA